MKRSVTDKGTKCKTGIDQSTKSIIQVGRLIKRMNSSILIG